MIIKMAKMKIRMNMVITIIIDEYRHHNHHSHQCIMVIRIIPRIITSMKSRINLVIMIIKIFPKNITRMKSMMNMVIIIIPWLITKMKSIMVIIIIMVIMIIMFMMIFPRIKTRIKVMINDKYGYQDYPLAYNQDEDSIRMNMVIMIILVCMVIMIIMVSMAFGSLVVLPNSSSSHWLLQIRNCVYCHYQSISEEK